MMKYTKLFSSMLIGNLEIRNRIVQAPMGVSMANVDGTPSEQMIAYYTERARGGVGLICTEITRVNDLHGVGEPAQLSVTHNRVIPSLQKLTQSVHAYGAKIFPQLHHPGRQTRSAIMFGEQPVAPSAIMCKITQEMPRALRTEEVQDIIQDFIDGALRAKLGGFDGVELHGAHGYLLNQFFSSYSNKRKDQYGGSLKNRVRIAVEIIEGIRQVCGPDFPVTVRVTVEEFMGKQGIELAEGIKICQLLEKAGAVGLGITSGIYESMNTICEPFSYEEGWRSYLAEAVKNEVGIPVYGNSVIRHPDFAEQLLQEDKTDFIGMGRQLLADPEWCNKAMCGRDEQICYCVSCLRCFESIGKNSACCLPLDCTVNARLGKEARYPYLNKDGRLRSVAIVGGGPAGMEAARVLAERHFKPVILESSDSLGGQMSYAKAPPHKEKISWFEDYLKNELVRLGVEIHLKTKGSIKEIAKLNPYAVILATGSNPILPDIPGADGDNVYSVIDIASKKVKLSDKKVAVIGSGMTGIEIAEMLAAQGNTVSIVEMLDKLTPDGYWQNVVDVMSRLNEYNVQFFPKHKLTAIRKNSIEMEGDIRKWDCDAVVLSIGVRSDNSLLNTLRERFERVVNVGDSRKTGRIVNAVSDAFICACNL